jgi:hypothetical protein
MGASPGEGMGEIDGKGGFTHAAFLTGNCDAGHSL